MARIVRRVRHLQQLQLASKLRGEKAQERPGIDDRRRRPDGLTDKRRRIVRDHGCERVITHILGTPDMPPSNGAGLHPRQRDNRTIRAELISHEATAIRLGVKQKHERDHWSPPGSGPAKGRPSKTERTAPRKTRKPRYAARRIQDGYIARRTSPKAAKKTNKRSMSALRKQIRRRARRLNRETQDRQLRDRPPRTPKIAKARLLLLLQPDRAVIAHHQAQRRQADTPGRDARNQHPTVRVGRLLDRIKDERKTKVFYRSHKLALSITTARQLRKLSRPLTTRRSTRRDRPAQRRRPPTRTIEPGRKEKEPIISKHPAASEPYE